MSWLVELLDLTGIFRPLKVLFWAVFLLFVVCSLLLWKPPGKDHRTPGEKMVDAAAGAKLPDPVPFAPPANAGVAPPLVTNPD